FLRGLFVIDKDQFIDRKIKQIFSHYFISYLQSNPNSSTNPFVLLVSPAFYESRNKYDCDVFVRVFDIISKQQLVIDESIANVTKFKYYYSILEATPILLGPLLSLFLRMGSSPSSQNCVAIIKKLFKKLFETNKSHADELSNSKLMPVIQEYLVSNLLNTKEHIFSSLIAIAAHYLTFISQALFPAKKLVEENDSKSCRQNNLLRN
ncbi:PREDICTED: uncharacterized protein LOC109589299, partial [Amphimedon queenslandica]|uniref:MMS22-like C-terminal domain-containing protein n=1 Tax=Amphimedon queenslandica TaxID=400682 RepID=A0AAN0JVM8_AMPQE